MRVLKLIISIAMLASLLGCNSKNKDDGVSWYIDCSHRNAVSIAESKQKSDKEIAATVAQIIAWAKKN